MARPTPSPPPTCSSRISSLVARRHSTIRRVRTPMPESDWRDPFAEEEAARDRERRRAQREAGRREHGARRRQRQGALADRVRDLLRNNPPPPPSGPVEASPPPPSRGPTDVYRRRRLGA